MSLRSFAEVEERATSGSRWPRLVNLVLALTFVIGLGVGAADPTAAQPTDESVEEATLALLPYLPPDNAGPAGYSRTSTRGWTNAAQALEAVTIPPADPRPPEALLPPLVETGRVVRLRKDFEKSDDPDAGVVSFNASLFRGQDGAAKGLQDPSLLIFILPDDKITRLDVPAIGDEAVGYRIEGLGDEPDEPYRSSLVAWRRGRVAFAVSAEDSKEGSSLPLATEFARQQDARIAGLPALPDRVGTPAQFMPTDARQLELYQALVERTLPDDVLPGETKPLGTSSIANAILLLDAPSAASPASDPRALADRLVKQERRILGVSRSIESTGGSANPPDSRFPSVSFGYHLYADAGGATEALQAPPAEIVLRLIEETPLPDPRELTMNDVQSVGMMGEQSRVLRTGFTTSDSGVNISVLTVRWRRGAVELFVNAAAGPGTNPDDVVRPLVEQLDATYSVRPLPGS